MPDLTVRYQSMDAYFLGLMQGESLELELKGETIHHYMEPTWWGGKKHRTTEYCYWVLKPGQEYTGFTVETSDCEMKGGLWHITALEDAVDVGEQCLQFVRYCMNGEDKDGKDEKENEEEEEEDDNEPDWWPFGIEAPGDE